MHIQAIPFCVCNEPFGAGQIIQTTYSGGKMRIQHTNYYGRGSKHASMHACMHCTHTKTRQNTHSPEKKNPELESAYLFKQYVCALVFIHICTLM